MPVQALFWCSAERCILPGPLVCWYSEIAYYYALYLCSHRYRIKSYKFCIQNMHPKVKLDDGAVVTIIDLPARNGKLAKVLGRVTRRYMIELFETGEKLVGER